MIDNIYVKKKKKKKTIVLVTSISSFLVSCFVIIALLSSFVGNYTIGVRDFKSRLVLSATEAFEDPSTFIRFDGFRNAVDYSYTMLSGPTRDAYLDNKDNEGPEKGLSPDQNGTYNFICYTFFLSNVGSKGCEYTFNMSITDNVADRDSGLSLDDVLRIRVYQNLVTGDKETETHDYVDYTKRNTLENGYTIAMKEWEEEGKLKYFLDQEDGTIINSESIEYLAPRSKMRFTLVFWLEANDPECEGERGNLAKAGITLATNIIGGNEEEDE